MIVSLGLAGPAFNASDEAEHPRPGRLDRASRLFLAAAQRAHTHATGGVVGVFVATTHGAFAANAEHWGHVLASGVHAVSPLVFPATVPSAAAGEAAIALHAMGPNVTICGDGERIVRMATQAIEEGECDAAYVGVVCGWHVQMQRLEPSPVYADGAMCAYLAPGRGSRLEIARHDNPLFQGFAHALLALTPSTS